MSEAATLEAPATVETTPATSGITLPDGGFTFSGSLADLVGTQNKNKPGNKVTPAEPAKVEPAKAAEPVKPAEVVADPAKPAEVVKPAEPAKENTAEMNAANMRKIIGEEKAAKEALQKELEALRKSHEEYRQKVPETAAEEAKSWRERAETAEKLKAETDKQLSAASLERSPEFQEKFGRPIVSKMRQMAQVAMSAGVPEAEAYAGVQNWETAKFDEWLGAMSESQKLQFGINQQNVLDLHQQKTELLANADKEWKAQQENQSKQVTAQQEQFKTNFYSQAKQVQSKILESEYLKDKPELQEVVKMGIRKANPFESDHFSPPEIMEQLAANPILHSMVKTHQEALTASEAKIAELGKKIAEQDAFIKKDTSTVTPGSGVAPAANTGAKVTLPWENISVSV